MSEETDKLITEQFDRLPKELQTALNTVPWKSSVKEIALLNKLSLEQVAIVERETMFILYGFENPEDYIGNMVREAQIDKATSTAIAEAVNEKIFKVIAEQINKQPAEKPSVPNVIHNNLPMVEEGEKTHDVPHVESTINNKEPTKEPEKPKLAIPTPDYRYPGGKDPYREPLK